MYIGTYKWNHPPHIVMALLGSGSHKESAYLDNIHIYVYSVSYIRELYELPRIIPREPEEKCRWWGRCCGGIRFGVKSSDGRWIQYVQHIKRIYRYFSHTLQKEFDISKPNFLLSFNTSFYLFHKHYKELIFYILCTWLLIVSLNYDVHSNSAGNERKTINFFTRNFIVYRSS